MTSDIDVNPPGEESGHLAAVRRYVGWSTLAYWAALFVSTHLPKARIPSGIPGGDKTVHLAAYAGLGFLTALWVALGRRMTLRTLFAVLAVLAVYGAVDEWLQQFVNRTPDLGDWLADCAGAAAGVVVVWALQTIRPLSRSRFD